MKKRVKRPSKAPIYVFLSVFIILAVGIAAILYFSQDRGKEYPEKITELLTLSDAGKYPEVEEKGEELLNLKPGKETKTQTLWEVSLAECLQGNVNDPTLSKTKYDEAIEHAKQYRKLDFAQSYYLMGLIYYYRGAYATSTGDTAANDYYTTAVDQFNKAKERIPDLKSEIDQYMATMPSSVTSQAPQ